jgi:NAD(P)-dependent dehydrogenase (short-subunit alcohol dehydrogenase family)
MRLKDKVAIVTGSGAGIGRAIATTFAREGARVVVADLDEEAGRETVAAIQAGGGEACFARTDVSQVKDTQRLVETALSTYGRLDVLVNNAGVYTRGDVVSTPIETWNRLLSINLTGVFLCCKAAIPALRQAGGGAIVNISSSVGWQYAAPGIAAYAASKFGVTGLTKAMACDHLPENIRVNCICPGPTDTPLIRASRSPEDLVAFMEAQPIGRLGSPDEIAAAALFLASDEASFVTGVAFPVDGGQAAYP